MTAQPPDRTLDGDATRAIDLTEIAEPPADVFDLCAQTLLELGGQWQVTTDAATYLLDLDQMRATRTAEQATQQLSFSHVLTCQAGQPMVLYVPSGVPGAVAVRRTTPVATIEPVSR